jgi:cytochrome c oxidase subunit III
VTTATLSPTQARAGRLPSRKLAVWLFLGTEIVFFAALILAYVTIRITSPNWPNLEQVQHTLNIPLTAVNTFILILSSVAVVLALDEIQHGRVAGLVRWLAVTLVLGATFLGVQVYEYNKLIHEGLTITESPIAGTDPHFGTTFFTMTGFHGLHVLAGVLTLLIVLFKAARGHYSRENHDGVELFGLYWHFVDAVWIVLFTLVYILY